MNDSVRAWRQWMGCPRVHMLGTNEPPCPTCAAHWAEVEKEKAAAVERRKASAAEGRQDMSGPYSNVPFDAELCIVYGPKPKGFMPGTREEAERERRIAEAAYAAGAEAMQREWIREGYGIQDWSDKQGPNWVVVLPGINIGGHATRKEAISSALAHLSIHPTPEGK